MSEWKKVKLGEITIIKTGKLDSNAAVSNGAYPFFTCDPTTLSIDKWAYDTEAILLAGNNASGNYTAKYYKGKFNAYQRTYIIETLNPQFVSVRFMAYAMNQQLQLLKVMSSGSTTKFLTMKMLTQLSIDLPSIETQNRIATILSRYDSLIENYQKQIKLLEEAAQRLYKEWFVDLHFPGHENTKIVDGVPEGWEKKPVKTIIELQSGYAFKSSAFMEDGIYKIVTIKNVKDGAFDGENVSKIASIPEKMPKHCILEDGDILLSLTGNVGRVCIVVGKNYLLNQRVAKLKSIFKAYTYCLFRSRDMFIDVNNLANGAAQQNVSPIKIGEMKILIPENKLLNEFEKESSNYISGVIAFQSQIHLLTEARDRLLPKLMSGEIAV